MKGNRQPSVTEKKKLLGKKENFVIHDKASPSPGDSGKCNQRPLCENRCFVNWYLHCEFNSLMEKHAEETLFPDRGVHWPLLRTVATECTSKLTTAFKDGETMNFETLKKKKKSSQILKTVYKKFKDRNDL